MDDGIELLTLKPNFSLPFPLHLVVPLDTAHIFAFVLDIRTIQLDGIVVFRTYVAVEVVNGPILSEKLVVLLLLSASNTNLVVLGQQSDPW